MDFIIDFKEKFSKVKKEEFKVLEINLFGIDSLLIYPVNPFIKWDENNRYFRSGIFEKDTFKPLSLGWRKFTNLEEQPEFEQINFKSKIEYIQKIDGSALYINSIKDNLCIRTRQTFDARRLENGREIDLLIEKYPKLFNKFSNSYLNGEYYTILTEWYSPTNKIVLQEADEPKLWLTGIIVNQNHSYLPQNVLDDLAKQWNIDRPKRYEFKVFDDAKNFVKEARDIEGIVLYCNNGQILKKCKTLRYLMLHKLKSELKSIENLIDLFITLKCLDYLSFKKYIEETFDHEIFLMVQGDLSRICDSYKTVLDIISGFQNFIDIRKDWDRKKLALDVISSYGNTNRASFVFELKDKGKLSDNSIKKLLFQVLKH